MHGHNHAGNFFFPYGSSIDHPFADGPSHDVTNDFLLPGCVWIIAASEKSTDTIWFVEILERC